MPMTARIDDCDFTVTAFHSERRVGAAGAVRATLATGPDSDPVAARALVGQTAEFIWHGRAPFSETACVARVEARRGEVQIVCKGPLAALASRRALRIWAHCSPAEVAAALCEEAGAEVESAFAGQAATAPAVTLCQNHISDHAFLRELGHGFGFAVYEGASGGLVLADAPAGATGTVVAPDGVTWTFDLAAGVSRTAPFEAGAGLEWLHVEEGTLPVAHPGATADPGFTALRETAEAMLRARAGAAAAAASPRASFPVQRGDLFVGDVVEDAGTSARFAIVARVAVLDETGSIVSHLEAVAPEAFPALPPDAADPAPGPALTIARVVERFPQGDGTHVLVSAPWVDRGASFPAQLLAWGGGGGTGPAWQPEIGAEVVLCALGEGVAPRWIVLGVLRHAGNAPGDPGDPAAPDIVLAQTPAGGMLRFSEARDDPCLTIGYGGNGARLMLRADGTVTLEGGAIGLAATQTIEISGSSAVIAAGAIDLKRR